MATQPHLLGKLEFDASVPDLDLAMQLRPRLEALVQERMPGAIERVFDALGPADMVLAIPRLDLDLGTLRPENLEEDALAALETQLEDALRNAIHAARAGHAAEARLVPLPAMRLERFIAYLGSGTTQLAGADPLNPPALLAELIESEPRALAAALRRYAHDRRALERLVLQAGGEGMRRLLALLAPADGAVILGLIADVLIAHRVEPVAALVRLAEPALERMVWVATLEFLLRDAGTQFNRRRFLSFLLHREAARAGVGYEDLLAVLEAAVARARGHMGFRSSLPTVLSELLEEEGLHRRAAPAAEAVPDVPETLEAALAAARGGDFAMLVALARARAADRPALEDLVRRLTPALFGRLIRAVEPANADLILAVLEDLDMVQAREEKPLPVPADVFALQMRALTLRYLLHDAGSQFNRRRFLAYLLEREAERTQMDYAALLRALAASVEHARVRTGFRSSLPAVLAELLAELEPIYAEGEAGEAGTGMAWQAALAAARGGELAPLLACLDARADGATLEAVARALPGEVFRALIEALRPGEARAILAGLDTLIALHAAEPLALLSDEGFALAVRASGLRAALRGTGGKAWLHVLLRTLGIADQSVGRAMRASGLRLEGFARVLAAAPAAEAPDSVEPEALRRLAGDSAALLRLAARTPPRDRERALAALDPVHAGAVAEDLRALARLHGAAALLPLGAAEFEALLWTLAVAWLAEPGGARFDRRTFARQLLQGVARYGGIAPPALAAKLRHGVSAAGAEGVPAREMALAFAREHGEPTRGEREQLRAIDHYLRTGAPRTAGRALVLLAARDPSGLAALVRSAAQDVPGAIERLLDWLMPEELLDLLAPGMAARVLAWADDAGVSGQAAWRELLLGVLHGEPPPLDAPPAGFGVRLDRLALIAHWLDHGALPWWAPRGTGARALLGEMAALSQAELGWLFATGDRRATAERLGRALAPLRDGERMRLLDRLVPWAAGTGGPLAPMLAALDAGGKLELLQRAAAAALEEEGLDLAALGEAAPTPVPPPAPVGKGAGKVDRKRLLAWLAGGHAAPAEAAALARYLARLADAGDAGLVDWLRANRAGRSVRAHWASVLPPEALGRVVKLLLPAGARGFIDAAMLLGAAWRRTAPFGARRGDPAELWAMLLDFATEPGLSLPQAIGRMTAALTGGDAEQAAKLRAEAQRLAQDGGHAAVAAALKRQDMALPAEPRRAKDAGEDVKEAEPSAEPESEEEPRHALYILNAGLVLLSPYLPVFFERLGVLSHDEEGRPRIAGLEAQSRAVHMLQYLVDERLDQTEPALVLNKLLCGMPTAAPVEPSVHASPADLELCDGLLHAVIANWPIIRNTSVAGLRETFLQREGRLLHGDEKWDLHVQRKGLDVLVDQIPWSFSTVFHRWMAEPVQVTW